MFHINIENYADVISSKDRKNLFHFQYIFVIKLAEKKITGLLEVIRVQYMLTHVGEAT